jgi:uncharacterized protein (DUF2252 family)
MNKREMKELSLFTQGLPQTHIQNVPDRVALGRELRQKTPRNLHAAWTPPSGRTDPVELLIKNSKGRMVDLLPIRYGRMMASPFTFYRGAAAIMAYDLAHTPSSGLIVQACGDCHLLNFGGFATSERRLIFDINDFDETCPAPWEWDVKRLAASFVIAGRANGFAAADCRQAAWNAAQSYREQIAAYAQMPVLDIWYDALDLEAIIQNNPDKQMKQFYSKKLRAATEQGAREKEFAKLAFAAGDQPRIIDRPPLIFHAGEQQDEDYHKLVENTMASYRASLSHDKHLLLERYRVADVAIKVVGVGSVGTMCGIVLLMSGRGDPLFLQIKQANKSVLEPYAGASPYRHAGQRVVVGQRLMQAAGDMFLGWATGAGADHRQFYVRQLSDAKIKPVIEIMKPANLNAYAGLCGRALARAHARSADTVVLSSYMGKSSAFEDALADFSEAYALQNERDHAALVAAVRKGKIEARME